MNFDLMTKLRQRPSGRAAMSQKWKNLLFLHWKFDIDTIQKTLPKGLFVDSYQNEAWVGIVPFFMRDIHPWWFPSVPGISNFLELNLRTYVYDSNGVPGVWFYSLAANQRLAVAWAKRFFHLPYFYTSMKAEVSENQQMFDYSMACTEANEDFTSRFQWRNEGELTIAKEESLEFFLLERYAMYNQVAPEKFRIGIVSHTPYQFQPVELFSYDDQMLKLAGLEPAGSPPDHVAFSPGVETEVFSLQEKITFDS